MSVIHTSHFYMILWSVNFRLYNKKAMKKFRIFHFIQYRDHKWFSIKPNSSDFQSSVNGKRWRVEWSSVFLHRSENLPFGKNLEDPPSPSFASLQCSCLISEDSGKWFPAFSWAHLVERSSLLWRKPNSLIGVSGYKKNAPWIKNKNILSFYFHQPEFCLQKKHHIYLILFPLWQPCRCLQTTKSSQS